MPITSVKTLQSPCHMGLLFFWTYRTIQYRIHLIQDHHRRFRVCACPVKYWLPIWLKIIQHYHDSNTVLSWKFENVMMNRREAMSVPSILHLRMRRWRLPYDFDDCDRGDLWPKPHQPSKFQPLLTIYTEVMGISTHSTVFISKHRKNPKFCGHKIQTIDPIELNSLRAQCWP